MNCFENVVIIKGVIDDVENETENILLVKDQTLKQIL